MRDTSAGGAAWRQLPRGFGPDGRALQAKLENMEVRAWLIDRRDAGLVLAVSITRLELQ